MPTAEEAIWIDGSDAQQMLGILHRAAGEGTTIGVVLVVGGPQYRVGSHRQFVLLARALAASGFPVLRFDYRGMGDSDGEPRDFEAIADDIGHAVDTLVDLVGVQAVVLWGLCDAASANAFYAGRDPRIVGQVALNPWVRTEEGEAQAFVRHYYRQRLLDPALWRKVMRLQFDVAGSLRDFLAKLRRSRVAADDGGPADRRPLPERVREAQLRFTGRTLLILSGNDLTASEYRDRVDEVPSWRDWTESAAVERRVLEAADHTFSRAEWRDQVATWCSDWLRRLAAD
jgi:exosortase A-associated hydrolase 1